MEDLTVLRTVVSRFGEERGGHLELIAHTLFVSSNPDMVSGFCGLSETEKELAMARAKEKTDNFPITHNLDGSLEEN